MTANPPFPTGEPDGPAGWAPAADTAPWAPAPAVGPAPVVPPAPPPRPSQHLPPPAARPVLSSDLPTPPRGPVPQQWLHYHALGWRPAGRPPRRGRGWWIVAVLALLATAVAVPVAASRAGHPTSSASKAPRGQADPAGAQQGDPAGHEFTTTDVRDLLDRYTTALSRHDQKALLAQLDRSNAKLVAAQRRLFDNLRQLDLATLQYIPVDLDVPEPDPAHPGRYTGGWVEAWRQMQIRGIDPVPGALYFRLQLKVATDHLVITDVAPAANPASNRQPSPWDVSTLRVVRTRNVLVAGTADVAGKLGSVAAAAQAAITDAGPCWPDRWQHTFTIFATGNRSQFSAWFRSKFTNTEFIGFEIGLPVVNANGDVVDGQADDVPQVVIDVPGALRAPLGFRQLLEHEMTHAASGSERNPDTETWAVEGYADFVAFHGGTLHQANRGGTAYHSFHSRGGLTVKLPSNADFYGRNAALNYDLAFLAYWYLREKYGQAAVVSFFTDANQHGNAGSVLQQHFHVTLKQFVDAWAKWVFAQLR